MNVREALDVSHLPTEDYGSRDTLWWGIMGLYLIEGMAMALLFASYFYLRMRYTDWPPRDAGLPEFTWAVPNILLMVATCYPMRRIEKEAPERSRMWLSKMLAVCALMIAGSCALRIAEFGSLNTEYYESSYGSITWAILFMHAIHLFLSLGEAGMLSIYCATHELDRKHRADLQVNSVYWYFVAALGVATFAVVWLAGRVL